MKRELGSGWVRIEEDQLKESNPVSSWHVRRLPRLLPVFTTGC